MKHKVYKQGITFLAICFLATTFAQNFDKKFTEKFKVNKDVEVAINAANTDINVTTWNRNEVQVEAFIEIEGLSKKEAEKYFKNWNFEALGNKSKVKITSKGSHSFGHGKEFIIFNDSDNAADTDLHFDFSDIHILNLDSIQLPNMENFVIPEIDFDFETMFSGLENLEFDIEKYMEDGKEYLFEWKDDANTISIKSKKEWEKFKKSKKYKELKEKMKLSKTEMQIELKKAKNEMKKFDKEKLKVELEKAKIEFKKIDREKIRQELAKAKEEIKKIKMSYHFDSDSKDVTINGKKIKIKKRLEIKVPKGATFDLNTRHCKVKLPNTKASGKVSYGSFDANNLNGGKLNIDFSKVTIADLNACTLFLNNVTDAKIASVTNTSLSNNSSGVVITKINENVELSNKFGALTIANISPNYQSFNLLLDYTDASLNTAGITNNLIFNSSDSSPLFPNKSSLKFEVLGEKHKNLKGNFIVKTKDNTLLIQGKYSQLNIKK